MADCIGVIDAEIFISLDYPPARNDTDITRREKISASVKNFQILIRKFPSKTIMPVVHGRTIGEIELSIQLINSADPYPEWIGLGGMVPLLRRYNTSKDIKKFSPELFIAKALKLIRQAFPVSKIHAFGAGGTRTFPAIVCLGANSADSIGWRQAAGFGSIFLPLMGERTISDEKTRGRTLGADDLPYLNACRCPICVGKTIDIKLDAFRSNFHGRSIHNAWTIANQRAFWPSTHSALIAMVADGRLGESWAKAVELSM